MKLIILDRDGVINKESREFIKCPAEWLPIPGSLETIAKLNNAGYTVVITTNQSGVGRGYFDLAMLNDIHNKLHSELEKVGGKISKIYFCPHLPDAGCNCRKPKTGMFEQIASDFDVDLKVLQPLYIGDSFRDFELAMATGCKFCLVTGPFGDGKETLHKLSESQKQQITIAEDLSSAVNGLLL
jgi:D-glycero-D-manno-heptose 1,7-bisphosphate phosphatase